MCIFDLDIFVVKDTTAKIVSSIVVSRENLPYFTKLFKYIIFFF